MRRKVSGTVGNTSVQSYATVGDTLAAVGDTLCMFLGPTVENCSQILRTRVKFDSWSPPFLGVLCRFLSEHH